MRPVALDFQGAWRKAARGVLLLALAGIAESALAVPPVPSFVSTTQGTYPGGVRIWWGAVSGAEAYDIWRSPVADKAKADYLASVGGSKVEYVDSSIPANTSYYYWVRTVIGKVASDFGYYHEGYWMPGPAAPTNVQATDGTVTNRVRLTWAAVSGATGYQVWRSLSDNSETASQHATTTSTTFTDDTVDPSLIYYYWVKAVNAEGVSGFSWSNPGNALAAVPEKIQNLQASDGTSLESVRVTWSPAAGTAWYDVWRAQGTELWTSERVAGNLTNTVYVDTNVVPMQSYTYWVRGVNSKGYGQFSAGDAGFREIQLPGKPTAVSASQGMYAGKVRVTWEGSVRATSYQILRNEVKDTPSATVVATVAGVEGLNEYWDTTGQGGAVYFYWIRGLNNAGTGEVSWSTTGFWNPGPSAPTNIQATDGTLPGAVRVTWTASSGAFLYEVWRNVVQEKQGAVLVGTSLLTTFLDSDVVPGQMYTYWVKAQGSTGTSGYSWSNNGYAEGPLPVVRTLSVAKINAFAGQTVTVPVSVQARGDENALGFSLHFDPSLLEFVGLSAGSGMPSGSFLMDNSQQAASGRVGVMMALSPGLAMPEGSAEIVRLEVKVLPGATNRLVVVDFADQPDARAIGSPTAQSLQATWVGGGVQVSGQAFAGYEADVSPVPEGDGTVTLLDWVQVGRFVSGLDVATPGTLFQRADCAPRNTLGDGAINLQDWVQAGRYAQGLDPLTVADGPVGTLSAGLPQVASKGSADSRSGGTGTEGFHRLSMVPGVTVRAVSVALADQPAMPVVVESDGTVNALSFTVSFDPAALSYQGTVTGPELQESGGLIMLDDRGAAEGRIGVAVAMPPGKVLPSGLRKVVEIGFAALLPDGEGPFEVALTAERVQRAAINAAAAPVEAVFESAWLTNGRIGGDPGDDGTDGGEPPRLWLERTRLSPSEGFPFSWNSRAGRTYRVEESFDLVEWHPLDRVTGQEGSTTYHRAFGSETSVFLRVVEEDRASP